MVSRFWQLTALDERTVTSHFDSELREVGPVGTPSISLEAYISTRT